MSVLWETIALNCSLSIISASAGIQMRPRASFAIKLMDSPVQNWAAMIRSPSFSRSSSSVTSTIFPALMAAMASSIVLNVKSFIIFSHSAFNGKT